jgi:dTDP-4-amino-4,6-dideoxygalactose transaminase
MIPYGRHDIAQCDIDAIVAVLQSDWLTQGPTVPAFERSVANYVGCRHAIAVNSATSALHIACLALGVGPGDWVWTSPNTFVASANCGLYCGAKVDFVDIDRRTYNLSLESLVKKLEYAELNNRLPKVIILVHFAGQPSNMPEIFELSEKYGFKIIEDASHALGASYTYLDSHDQTAAQTEVYTGKRVMTKSVMANKEAFIGSCEHSHITVFSFHPVKIITTGEGGMALTNDEGLRDKLVCLRAHGVIKEPELMWPKDVEEIWNYQQIELGFNYRMTDLQAALGISQMTRIGEFISYRRAIAEIYDEAFSNTGLITPWQNPGSRSSFHLYPVRVCVSRTGKNQRQVYGALRDAGIGVNIHYIPVYLHPYFEAKGFCSGYCPESESYYRETISLPIYPSLSGETQDHIIKTINNVLQIR